MSVIDSVRVYVIDANLDAEAKWAGGSLPGGIATRVSYYAALLSVLAPPDVEVEVWAPATIDVSRLVACAAWRPPTMCVGTPPAADLVWAPRSAKAANDRRLARLIARELAEGSSSGLSTGGASTGVASMGAALTGASSIALDVAVSSSVIATVDELVAWTARGGRWVAKAPWTTAGRDRCHGEGTPSGEQRTRIARLLEKFGALVVEPWLDRVFDVGLCARVDEFRERPSSTGREVHATESAMAHDATTATETTPTTNHSARDFYVTTSDAHSLITDARGTFLGIDLAPPALEAHERTQLGVTARTVGARLAAMGFRGPFAIDAFVYRDARGTRRLHALCEINARTTFGHVARAFGARGFTRLGFGAPPEAATVLVRPADDGVTAWIA
ncbi:MAG: hypothetical protein ACKV2T_20995 [Kofleriaceae bacterium]